MQDREIEDRTGSTNSITPLSKHEDHNFDEGNFASSLVEDSQRSKGEQVENEQVFKKPRLPPKQKARFPRPAGSTNEIHALSKHQDHNYDQDTVMAPLLDEGKNDAERDDEDLIVEVIRIPRLNSTKRKARFPGPAGVIHLKRYPVESESQSTQFQAQQLTKLELTDRNLAWQHLLQTEEVASCENSIMLLDVYNIEWAKKKTVKTGITFKMPMLAAAIKSVKISGFDSYECELLDPTGTVCCLFHPDLFDQHGESVILAGTVLLLKNVSVLKQTSGKLYAVVTPNNVVSIYWMKEKMVNVKTFCRLSKDDVYCSVVKLNQDEKTQFKNLAALDSKTETLMGDGVESQTPTFGTSLPAEKSILSRQYSAPSKSNYGSNLALPLAEPTKQSSSLGAEIQEPTISPRTVQNSNATAAARCLQPVSPFALCPEKVRVTAASPSTDTSLVVIEKSLTTSGNEAEANKSRFTFKPILKPSKKPLNIPESQATQDKPVNVETLFEGLDEESIFGDF